MCQGLQVCPLVRPVWSASRDAAYVKRPLLRAVQRRKPLPGSSIAAVIGRRVGQGGERQRGGGAAAGGARTGGRRSWRFCSSCCACRLLSQRALRILGAWKALWHCDRAPPRPRSHTARQRGTLCSRQLCRRAWRSWPPRWLSLLRPSLA